MKLDEQPPPSHGATAMLQSGTRQRAFIPLGQPSRPLTPNTRARLTPDELKEALKRSLQEQLAELAPHQRLALQRKILQQRLKEHARRTKTVLKQGPSQQQIVVERRPSSGSTGHQQKRRPSTTSTSTEDEQPDPDAMHACDACGKMYKHKACLTKHQWEHHQAWEETKRYCQTKHQQVQLLEAAQMLTDLQDRRP